MRWWVFLIVQLLLVLGVAGVVYIHQDRTIVLKKPPQTLAQWYKPQNKRQVWLHTMFKLRRELQAVEMYATAKDSVLVQKWAAKLNQDYPKITKMVPQWASRVDLDSLADIQQSATDNRYQDVIEAVQKLDGNCQSCHRDFRAVTATLYRAPDFSKIEVEGAKSLNEQMQRLSLQVNRIKLGFVDGKRDAALSALAQLRIAMTRLGETCTQCHKKPSWSYPDEQMSSALTTLEQSLKTGTLQNQGRALGTLAVLACARCHGTHRLSNDAKNLFSKNSDWAELLKHSF